MDTEIGRLLDAIGPVGSTERDNTIIIFMGDNGTPASVRDKNVRVRSAKSSIYEGGIRVPMIISGAGVARSAAEETALVTASDLYATIAELSGIPVSQIHDSYSLGPLLTDNSGNSGRMYAFAEYCSSSKARYAIRGNRYKLLYDNGARRLYDLVNDPLETNNLFGNSGVAAEQTILQAELTTLAQAATYGCFHEP
jgi:arylsulfatase A-like enzyme